MRYLVCFKVKEDNKIIKKVEMHTSKAKDIELGKLDVALKLSTQYDIPEVYINWDAEEVGFVYINPKDTHVITDLCDIEDGSVEDNSDIMYGEYNIR